MINYIAFGGFPEGCGHTVASCVPTLPLVTPVPCPRGPFAPVHACMMDGVEVGREGGRRYAAVQSAYRMPGTSPWIGRKLGSQGRDGGGRRHC